MPLNRDQILALRKEFEQEFGGGESEWADTTPEGLRYWEKDHSPRWNWFLGAYSREVLRVTVGGYAASTTFFGNYVTADVFTNNSRPVQGGTEAVDLADVGFLTYRRNAGGTNVMVAGHMAPLKPAMALLETQFEAVLT